MERARNGGGPSLLECKTYRWKGHVGPECDYEKGCRPKEELDSWIEKCPVATFKKDLLEQGVITPDWYDDVLRELDMLLDSALTFGKNSPFPEDEALLKHIYYEKSE